MVPGVARPIAILARDMARVNPPKPAAPSCMSFVTCWHRVAASTGSESTDAATVAACWFIRSSSSDSGFMSPPTALPALRELTLQLGDEFCGVILLFMLEFALFWRRLARRRRSTQGPLRYRSQQHG